jgi:hypothetical protein
MPLYTHKELFEELEWQVTRLFQNGYGQERPENVFEQLRGRLPRVLEIEQRVNGTIPLLLVLPLAFMPFDEQLKLVQYYPRGDILSTRQGAYSYLNPLSFRGPTFSGQPYLLLDVEDGTERVGYSAVECEVAFKNEDRLGFTVEQGLALAVLYPETFHHHNILLSAARMTDTNNDEFVPDFWVYAGKVKMKRDSPQDQDSRWGAPSYNSIITL